MRFLLVIFPAQGHINPGLQFAKRLILMGAEVTFVTSLSAHRRMTKPSTPTGLSFAPFSNCYDDGFKPGDDMDHYLSEISRCGSQNLTDLIVTAANEGHPFSFIIYSILLPWAAETANQLHVPSALLWIQPATVFDIYYYYFHDYSDVIDNTNSDSTDGISCFVEFPGLPLKLTKRDLPSFMDAGNTYTFAVPLMKAQFEILDKESNPKVLLNTFDALEPEALRATGGKFDLIGVGPLIPSAFLDGKDPSDTSFGGDFVQHSKDYYMEWLNTKPKKSVIYVSFGSMSVLSKPQMEELGRALLSIGRPFLWVIRDKKKDGDEEEEDKLVSCREELERFGMLVPWCSQVEVLSNPSLGCFVTHCGWNSTLESLVCGVPMVGFPQWSDQGTNAKLIEDFWKTGLRVKTNKDGIVERDEFQRCLEIVMGDGEKGEEMRLNAKKWKDLSREAANEGGSSDKNLKDFVNEINLKEAAVS